MSVLFRFTCAGIGAITGMVLGDMMTLSLLGEVIDLRIVLALFGVIVGYLSGGLLSRFVFRA